MDPRLLDFPDLSAAILVNEGLDCTHIQRLFNTLSKLCGSLERIKTFENGTINSGHHLETPYYTKGTNTRSGKPTWDPIKWFVRVQCALPVEFLTSNRLMCNWCCDDLTEADKKAAEEARQRAKAKAVNPITENVKSGYECT